MSKVLVIGGAGYVGGTMCAWLLDHGHAVWVLDDLSTGHRASLDRLPGLAGFTCARAGDQAVVRGLLERERFDCVMHFAARALVAESVARPELYRENNVEQTRLLLDAMLAAGTRRFVFSSTCAIFGDPGGKDLDEDSPKNPVNPYGRTKLEAELLMRELAASRGLQCVALRYFNAAGAEPRGRVGEWHDVETHLIPRLLKAALDGSEVELFGTDYPTPDGTAVRDYVHVCDLAAAHEAAMRRLLALPPEGGSFEAFNLGTERGSSVREMIAACEAAVGRRLRVAERPRRAGDPPRLVANAARARAELGFAPGEDSLRGIFASAWAWEQGLARLAGPRRAVFLDRDGTLNVDPGYLSDPSQMELLPGVGAALASLRAGGYSLIVISNQSGVGRGIIAPDALPRIHARMEELLVPYGATIDHYGLCIHKPEDDCECRKPKAKLLHDAARALGIDLGRSYMVGDKLSDLRAGRAAGCRASVLVRTGYGRETERAMSAGDADFTGDGLAEAAGWILGRG